jgi:predicted RNA-binding Zn ribbon-like protein
VTEVQSSPGRERSVGLSLSEVIPAVERRAPDPQPANRAPAPGDLALVQALVNSFHNLDTRREEFDSPAGLTDWLIHRELLDPGERLTQADLTRVLDVREGLRALMYANNHERVEQDSIERMNRALRAPGLAVQLDAFARPDFRSARRDLDSALALIATIVAVAQLDGRFARLKACPGHDCGWAFYDSSRNQASGWCSMQICGQRAKARAYRQRRTGRQPKARRTP